MAKRNIITDSNGDRMTEKEYAATLDLDTTRNYVTAYVLNHGEHLQTILDVALSLPDYCAFEIEVEDAHRSGAISDACCSRLWKMGHDVWMWFGEYIEGWVLTLDDVGCNTCWL